MSGEQKWYLPGTSELGDVEYTGAVTGGNGNTTEETLASAPVVLLTEYQAHPENYDPATGFWILDDTADGNGWCYWSKLLPAGKATNLLLDNVTLDPENKPDDNYAYNIDVRLQAANKTEAYKLADKGDISEAAQELTHDLAADVVTTQPDGKLVRNISGNIWEELDDNGNSLVPRQFIYDGDGSIGKDKEYSGDELACDRNGVIALAGGLFVKGTDNPNVFESVNQDGTSKAPKQYVFTPDKNPEDYVYDEAPMVTGRDGLNYLKVDDTTYICTENGLVMITPDASTLPGGPDDVVQTPTWPSPLVSPQPIKFRVLPIPTQAPGDTYQTQVEFDDPSQEAAAKPLRYIALDVSSAISINQNGVLSIGQTAPSMSYAFYVIAADGSFQQPSVQVQPATTITGATYQATSFAPQTLDDRRVNKGKNTSLGVSLLSSDSTNVFNIAGYAYTIQGNALGCTLTPSGLFAAGDTLGTVMIKAEVSCVNKSSSTIQVTDGDGSTFQVLASDPYTMTVVFNVIVNDPAAYSAEVPPYITKLTDLGVTSWSDVEPASDYAGGNGSKGMPYKISSVRQLKKFVNGKGDNNGYAKYFELTADMDFTGADTVDGYLLGTLYGTLDGAGHVIKNLNSSSGILGSVYYGTVSNFGRTGGSVTPAGITSAFVGVLGYGGKLIRCYNATSFTNSINAAGGLVCTTANGNATIDHCYNTGTILSQSASSAGGLVSYVRSNGGMLTINDSYNAGDISGSANVGGIIGNLSAVSDGQTVNLNNVCNYGRIIRISGAYPSSFGGIIGNIAVPTAPSYQKATLTGASYVSGCIYYNTTQQPDTDIGSRPVTPATWPTGITVTGMGTPNLTGPVPTGFLP